MQKIMPALFTLILSCAALSLGGCFPGVYKIDIQQGNIVTQDMLDQLKPGMTRRQVHYVLGTPIATNTFDTSLESYVYTIQRAGGDIQTQTIDIHYQNDVMTHYSGSLLPPDVTGLTPRPTAETPIFEEEPFIPD